MLPSLPRPQDYDVSPLTGFLPEETPIERLSDSYYAPWETVITNLQALTLTRRLRNVINNLPVLDTSYLKNESEWRRAYSIMGFIVHAYIWGSDFPTDIIPPPISIPFLEMCRHLELPPVATYAGLVLWNWKPLSLSEPLDSLENLFTLHTITGYIDESWFYLVSTAIEARGAAAIPLMLNAIEAARNDDIETVTESLRQLAELLDDLGQLLPRMYENCDAHIFYHRIRPVLAGSKNMADAGLPNGVKFNTGSLNDEYVQFSGGSNAQSSLIQFFDIVLGIQHRATGIPTKPSRSIVKSADATRDPPNSFIHEMRRYMPGPHSRFLHHVERVANIREYVNSHETHTALRLAYDMCLAMLRHFRDIHIQMVSRYIIVKSRSVAGATATTASPSPQTRKNLATATSAVAHTTASGSEEDMLSGEESRSFRSGNKKLRGTGGTALIPFLKQARDETTEPAVDAWARRLLHFSPQINRAKPFASLNVTNPETSSINTDHVDVAKRGGAVGEARLTQLHEHASGEREVVGLAGVWKVDDSEGGICHW